MVEGRPSLQASGAPVLNPEAFSPIRTSQNSRSGRAEILNLWASSRQCDGRVAGEGADTSHRSLNLPLEKLFPSEKPAARQLCDLFPGRAPFPASNLSSVSMGPQKVQKGGHQPPQIPLRQVRCLYHTGREMGSQGPEQRAGGGWVRSSMANHSRAKGTNYLRDARVLELGSGISLRARAKDGVRIHRQCHRQPPPTTALAVGATLSFLKKSGSDYESAAQAALSYSRG